MSRLLSAFVVVIAISVSALTPVQAEPVAEEDRLPVDLRRTTLVVKDMEKSLAFYRDAMGMKVVYDNMILTPRDAASEEEAERSAHLVFLQANDTYIGIIGLLHYRKPAKELPESQPDAFMPGSIVLVFNLEDAQATYDKAITMDGVVALYPPEETTYPAYDGTGTIPVLTSGLKDPDGHVVEINQHLVDDPLNQ